MGSPLGAYSTEIYLRGLDGVRPDLPTDPNRLEDAARAVLAEEPFDYVAGGAGTGATMRANRAAFDRYGLVPRMLRNNTSRDWSTTLLGTAMPAPLLLAPIGVQSLLHAEGELAVARAAAELGVPMVLSTAASHSTEAVAAASGEGPRWYQLYWPTDDDVTISLVGRARAADFAVLVVTLDTWTLGWRPQDLDRGYLPFLRGIGTAIPFSDPAFRAALARPPEDDLAAAVRYRQRIFTGTARSWDRLALLRRHWDGPIVLKGIQHVDDALAALDAGMDGVIVSNHGGRQVDRAVGSLQAAVRLRHPHRRGRRGCAGARRRRGTAGASVRLRAGARWAGRGAARPALRARGAGPHTGPRRVHRPRRAACDEGGRRGPRVRRVEG
ncbi:MAG: alpha-hydroxy-acid oxidizing enzyme [Pseudonocardia sp.]|nr:alpha-hydroxy-acid oxidizing enzyme [Pseudonocardia sp.]